MYARVILAKVGVVFAKSGSVITTPFLEAWWAKVKAPFDCNSATENENCSKGVSPFQVQGSLSIKLTQ